MAIAVFIIVGLYDEVLSLLLFSIYDLTLDSRHVMRPMIIGQLRLNMSNFEEFKVCADILNEMLSNFVKSESMVRFAILGLYVIEESPQNTQHKRLWLGINLTSFVKWLSI